MGNLCTKDDTKKQKDKKKDEEATEEHTGESETTTTNVDDDAADYPDEDEGPRRPKRAGTEPFTGPGGGAPYSGSENFGSEWDEMSTPVNAGVASTQRHDDKSNSVMTRDDIFPANQDKDLNMRIGVDKYRSLDVLASSDEDRESRELHSLHSSTVLTASRRPTEAEGTPERQRAPGAAANGAYTYNPMNFKDEDTSIVERNSDAFDTPREHFTESMMTAASDRGVTPVTAPLAPAPSNKLPPRNAPPPTPPAAAAAPVAAEETRVAPTPPAALIPQPVTISAPAPVKPNEPFDRFPSAMSVSSFTVTTVRNNNRTVHTPHASQSPRGFGDSSTGGHNWDFPPLTLSEGSPRSRSPGYPVGTGEPNAFYSCRSDATLATTAASSVRGQSPRGVGPGAAAPFQSCRSLDSLSSQSVAALRLPVRPAVTGANGKAPPPARRTAAGAKTGVVKPAPKKGAVVTRRPVKRPVAETPLGPDANVVKAVPVMMPLPGPRVIVAPSPTESDITTATTAAQTPPPAATATLGLPSRTRNGAQPVASAKAGTPSAASAQPAPTPSSAFQSFPPTPSAYGDSEFGTPISQRRVLPSPSVASRPRATVTPSESAARAAALLSSPLGVPSPTATHATTQDRDELESSAFHSMISPSNATVATPTAGGSPVGQRRLLSPTSAPATRPPMLAPRAAVAATPMPTPKEKALSGAAARTPSLDEYPTEEAAPASRLSATPDATRPTQTYRDTTAVADIHMSDEDDEGKELHQHQDSDSQGTKKLSRTESPAPEVPEPTGSAPPSKASTPHAQAKHRSSSRPASTAGSRGPARGKDRRRRSTLHPKEPARDDVAYTLVVPPPPPRPQRRLYPSSGPHPTTTTTSTPTMAGTTRRSSGARPSLGGKPKAKKAHATKTKTEPRASAKRAVSKAEKIKPEAEAPYTPSSDDSAPATPTEKQREDSVATKATEPSPSQRRRASVGASSIPSRSSVKRETASLTDVVSEGPDRKEPAAAPLAEPPTSEPATLTSEMPDMYPTEDTPAPQADEEKDASLPQEEPNAGDADVDRAALAAAAAAASPSVEAEFLNNVREIDALDGGQPLYEGLASSSSSSAGRDVAQEESADEL